MALPDLIEIIPLSAPVRAEITVPGSKSITNRALLLAALADGEVTLTGALWSEDTQIMVECLKELGFVVHVTHDPEEPCNRTILVVGEGGLVPAGGTEREPLELFVGNAGTAARFLAPLLCLGSGVYRLSGVPRMHERPQAAMFHALHELGYRVEPEYVNDKLPARIYGEGPKKGKCRVSIEESSQFASALLLSSKIGGWEIEIIGENAEESPYVAMTSKLMEAFPKNGGTFQIEPDASSGSYFWAAGWVIAIPKITQVKTDSGMKVKIPQGIQIFTRTKGTGFLRGKLTPEELPIESVKVQTWPSSGLQIDAAFPMFLPAPSSISRANELADSIMTLIVLSADQDAGRDWNIEPGIIEARETLFRPINFSNLGRLRVQETERVFALKTELTKCGARVVEEGDTLTVYPSELHGAEIETYNDHRMAMCFAILGLKVPGITIKNPACVKKTFPNFFQKLSAAPPHGLGAEIWEVNKQGRRTRRLDGHDLFAE
ncbi:MAG: hypothetical protein WDM80_17380 [Limisphaerales bacterium]